MCMLCRWEVAVFQRSTHKMDGGGGLIRLSPVSIIAKCQKQLWCHVLSKIGVVWQLEMQWELIKQIKCARVLLHRIVSLHSYKQWERHLPHYSQFIPSLFSVLFPSFVKKRVCEVGLAGNAFWQLQQEKEVLLLRKMSSWIDLMELIVAAPWLKYAFLLCTCFIIKHQRKE